MHPSFGNGYAKNPTQAAHPSLWQGLERAFSFHFGPTGAEAIDFSAHRKNGTFGPGIGRDQWVKDPNSGDWAVSFGGTHDSTYMDTGYVFGPVWTIAVRFTPFSLTSVKTIVAAADTGTDYQLLDTNGTALGYYESGSGGPAGANLGITGLSIGTTYLLTVTREGDSVTNGIKGYLNGEYKGQANSGAALTLPQARLADRAGNTSQWNPCWMGFAKFWNRVLTPQEIAILAAGGSPLDRATRRVYGLVPAGGGAIEVTPSPVTGTWSVVAPTLSKQIAPSPVSGTWSVVAPAIAKSITPDPLTATWSTVAPALSKNLTVSPVTGTWSVPEVTTGAFVVPDPVVGTWSVPAVTTSKAVSVSPVTATWSVPQPTLTKTIAVSPVTATWTVTAAGTSRSVTTDPVTGTWSVAAPSLSKSITPSPVTATWSIVAPELSGPVVADPPDTPSITVVDNGDGTATVTVADSSASSSNQAFTATWDGDPQGTGAWTSAGSARTGDGEIDLTLTAGPYWFYVTSTLNSLITTSPPVYSWVTDGTQSLLYQCVLAVQARIRSLSLTNIPNVDVRYQKYEVTENKNNPSIIITPGDHEVMDPTQGTNARDDVLYPVMVNFYHPDNHDQFFKDDRDYGWRERVCAAFRHQVLSGVAKSSACVCTAYARPLTIVEQRMWDKKGRFHGSVLILIRIREARGLLA